MSTVPPSIPPKRRGTPPWPAFTGATALGAAHTEPATALNVRQRAEVAARVQEYARQQAAQAPHGSGGSRPAEPVGLSAVVSGIPILQARMRAFDAGARAAAQVASVGGMMGSGAPSAVMGSTPRVAVAPPRPPAHQEIIATRVKPGAGLATYGVRGTIALPRTIFYGTESDYSNFYLGFNKPGKDPAGTPVIEAGVANSPRTGERGPDDWHVFVHIPEAASLGGQDEIYRGYPHRRTRADLQLEIDPTINGRSLVTVLLDGEPVWAGWVRLDRRQALGKFASGIYHAGGMNRLGRFGPVQWSNAGYLTPDGRWERWHERTPTNTDTRRAGRLHHAYLRSYDTREDRFWDGTKSGR